MKKRLTILLWICTVGICAVMVVQWKREFVLLSQKEELEKALGSENEGRTEAEAKAERMSAEIERISSLRAETETALQTARDDIDLLTVDMQSRGLTIGVLAGEGPAANPDEEAGPTVAEVVRDRNTEVAALNAAVEKANGLIRKLTGERDDAISKLNQRIREYNELADKHRKAQGGR